MTSSQQEVAYTSYRFRVENLHCAACENRLRALFVQDRGVALIEVDIPEKTIAIHSERDDLTDELANRLADAGFLPAPYSADINA